jgi:hypothetical protein
VVDLNPAMADLLALLARNLGAGAVTRKQASNTADGDDPMRGVAHTQLGLRVRRKFSPAR